MEFTGRASPRGSPGTGIHQSGEFELVFEVMEGPKDWLLNVKYRTAAFGSDAIDRLANQYQELLAGVGRNPGQALTALQPAENRTSAGSATNGFDYPRQRCVHQLIEEQASRTPDAAAVLFRDQRLSYRELDTRGNQFAHS